MNKIQKVKIMEMFENSQTPYDEFIKHYILEESITKQRLSNIKAYLLEIRSKKGYYERLASNWKKEKEL